MENVDVSFSPLVILYLARLLMEKQNTENSEQASDSDRNQSHS